MGRRPKVAGPSSAPHRTMPPAITPEADESQMISLAMDLVRDRLLNGTATSQETTHFLKLASGKERLEMEMMRKQMALLEAKVKSYESQDRMEDLLERALRAFSEYKGDEGDSYDDD